MIVWKRTPLRFEPWTYYTATDSLPIEPHFKLILLLFGLFIQSGFFFHLLAKIDNFAFFWSISTFYLKKNAD